MNLATTNGYNKLDFQTDIGDQVLKEGKLQYPAPPGIRVEEVNNTIRYVSFKNEFIHRYIHFELILFLDNRFNLQP